MDVVPKVGPKLYWTDAFSSNTTAQRQYTGLRHLCEVATPPQRCIVQVGLGHGSIHEPHYYMTRLDHLLWLCRFGPNDLNFSAWTGYFPRKKSGEFEALRVKSGQLTPGALSCLRPSARRSLGTTASRTSMLCQRPWPRASRPGTVWAWSAGRPWASRSSALWQRFCSRTSFELRMLEMVC